MSSLNSFMDSDLSKTICDAELLTELRKHGCITVRDLARIRIHTLINNKVVVKKWDTLSEVLVRLHLYSSTERGSERIKRK